MEKGILFSGEMVRALLDGRKTQTRRVVTPQPATNYAKSPYQVGDMLYVRETWMETISGYYYKATNEFEEKIKHFTWRPSIHMPKKAARIWLKVTDVSVERLQDISEEDALREGIKRYPILDAFGEYIKTYVYGDYYHDTAKKAFQKLWNKIYGKKIYCSWNENPWVFVYLFERSNGI